MNSLFLYYQIVFFKLLIFIVGRALSFALCKGLGCSRTMNFAIRFSIKIWIFPTEAMTDLGIRNWMQRAGDASGSSLIRNSFSWAEWAGNPTSPGDEATSNPPASVDEPGPSSGRGPQNASYVAPAQQHAPAPAEAPQNAAPAAAHPAAAANPLPAIQPAEPNIETVKDAIRNRFFLGRQGPVSDDEIHRIIDIKRRIFHRMGQLDLNPFWEQRENTLIRDYLLPSRGAEFKVAVLERKLNSLNTPNATESKTYKELLQVRKDFTWDTRSHSPIGNWLGGL